MQAEADRVHALLDAEIAATQAAADAAAANAALLRAAADLLQGQAEAALLAAQASPITLISGGKLEICAGGSVGTVANNLSIEVPGTITVKSGGSVYLGSNSAMSIKQVTGNAVSLTATQGTITEVPWAAYPSIVSASLGIFALEKQDVGQKSNYIDVWTSALNAIGVNIYINNLNKAATAVGLLGGEEEVFFNTGGAVTAQGSGIINGTNVVINAGGPIGETGAPMIINAGSLSMQGAGDLNLTVVSYSMNVDYMVGRTVTIEALGNIGGGVIYATNLWIEAQGNIGAPLNKMVIYVSRIVHLVSEYGGVYYVNIYPFYDKWMERQLQPHYMAVYSVALLYFDSELGAEQTFCMLIGYSADTGWDVLGFYMLSDAQSCRAMTEDIMQRGVEGIDILFTDGNAQLAEAFTAAFEGTAVCVSTYLWALNAAGAEDMTELFKEMLEDLRNIYCESDYDTAQQMYEEFIDKWQDEFPETVQHLLDNWQCYTDAFAIAAGFDFELIEQMTLAMKYKVERRGSFSDIRAMCETMFDIMVWYFPQYKSERIS